MALRCCNVVRLPIFTLYFFVSPLALSTMVRTAVWTFAKTRRGCTPRARGDHYGARRRMAPRRSANGVFADLAFILSLHLTSTLTMGQNGSVDICQDPYCTPRAMGDHSRRDVAWQSAVPQRCVCRSCFVIASHQHSQPRVRNGSVDICQDQTGPPPRQGTTTARRRMAPRCSATVCLLILLFTLFVIASHQHSTMVRNGGHLPGLVTGLYTTARGPLRDVAWWHRAVPQRCVCRSYSLFFVIASH
jgi:hypothetical protein